MEKFCIWYLIICNASYLVINAINHGKPRNENYDIEVAFIIVLLNFFIYQALGIFNYL